MKIAVGILYVIVFAVLLYVLAHINQYLVFPVIIIGMFGAIPVQEWLNDEL
jgi:hypothetical protein